MAKGIDLSGMHAGGINDALVDLIVQKQVAEDRAAAQEQRALAAKRQAMLDAQAAEDREFTRTRLTKQDARTERLDAQTEKDKNTARLMKLAENFPGARAKRSAFGDVPADLDSLILKPLDPTVESTAIGGFASMPGAARREGGVTMERHEAIEPGTVEIQEPESERRRIADAKAAAQAEKGEKDRELAQQRLTEQQRHNEAMELLRRQGDNGTGPLVRVTFTDPDTGDTYEQDVTREEAVRLGPRKKPKPTKAATGAQRDSLAFYNRAKKASDALAAGGLEERIAEQGAASALWGANVPSLLQTEDQQRYDQAKRAFAEAFLREQSGAAIANSEYANIDKIYFAQPGDSPEVIKSKQQMRQGVIEGLKYQSGKAFDEFYGESGGGSDPGKGQVELIFDPKTGRAVPKER